MAKFRSNFNDEVDDTLHSAVSLWFRNAAKSIKYADVVFEDEDGKQRKVRIYKQTSFGEREVSKWERLPAPQDGINYDNDPSGDDNAEANS
jgi:hypothetical protein